MHPCTGKWMAIERVIVYYARVCQEFSAGIKCRHCSYLMMSVVLAGYCGTHHHTQCRLLTTKRNMAEVVILINDTNFKITFRVDWDCDTSNSYVQRPESAPIYYSRWLTGLLLDYKLVTLIALYWQTRKLIPLIFPPRQVATRFGAKQNQNSFIVPPLPNPH